MTNMKIHASTSSFAVTHSDEKTLTNKISQNIREILEASSREFNQRNIEVESMLTPSVALVSHNGVIYGTVTVIIHTGEGSSNS